MICKLIISSKGLNGLKRSLILCVIIVGALLISAVGCQRDSAVLPSDIISDLSSQADSLPTSSLDASVVESTLDSQSASKAPVSSQASSSSAPASTPAEGKESSIPSPSSSEPPVSYTFRSNLSEQLEGINENNIPETVFVVVNFPTADADKQYDESFFDCDITIVRQGSYGAMLLDSNLNRLPPFQRYFFLKVNQPGLKGLYDVLEILDQREDIARISVQDTIIIPE